MPERIYKLQPDRTLALRGFDTFASAASIHSASPAGFTISGTFRDPADFAVAVLYDADNYYDHPLVKYLPDFNFSGLTLSFNYRYSDGVQPVDSPKYNWIDWATLDCALASGSTASIPLFDHSMLTTAGGAYTAASGTFNLTTSSQVQPGDSLAIWYGNIAFPYTAPNTYPTTATFNFYAGSVGAVHSITINGATYSTTEISGDSSAAVAARLASVVSDPYCTATAGSYMVTLAIKAGQEGQMITVSASDDNGGATLYSSSPTVAAAALAAEINGATNWAASNSLYALMASASGPALTITAAQYGTVSVAGSTVTWVSGTRFGGISSGATILLAGTPYQVSSVQSPTALTLTSAAATATGIQYVAARGGRDGNLISLYATAPASTLNVSASTVALTGGSSDATWNCTLDFTALAIDQLRQCWLTFAPSLSNGTSYTATEWQVVFSNWTLIGAEATKALTVAGPGSIRIEEDDSACTFHGAWTLADSSTGWYSQYYATASTDATATVTINYSCQFPHDLWIGTSLYTDRATVNISVDGVAQTPLNCALNTGSPVISRRKIATGITAGAHTVVIAKQDTNPFYFDFLEAAVASDVPDALTPRTNVSPAIDFDTDHAYKLSPARLMWIYDKLGYAGPMNEYLGVFWWNERTATGLTYSSSQVTFAGTYAAADAVILTLNGTDIGKSVFAGDTANTIAAHFAMLINATFTGVWASAASGVLTITGRSPASAYSVSITVKTLTSAHGTATVSTITATGSYDPSNFVTNDTTSQPLNRAARDWHADFYALCAARSLAVTTACSMELVYPPSGYAAKFANGTAVSTATGFGTIVSNHCAIGSPKMLAYQKSVYRSIAALQQAAGLTPRVQYGEFLWWYFAGSGTGMAFYDADTTAAALTALGRPLASFNTPADDPTINSSADAIFLRNRLRDHVSALVSDIRSAYPTVQCEVLWPYDVNYPATLSDGLGGQLNRFINLPVEWQTQATSGLDRMKVEALAFSSGLRNLNLSAEAINLFPGFGWARNLVTYLLPVFGQGTPWEKELALVWAAGLQNANFWALDHICLYGLDVPEGAPDRRSLSMG